MRKGKKPVKRKVVFLTAVVLLLLSACGRETMTEETACEVVEEFNNGDFRYSIKTEIEDPYEDPDVTSVGIGPETPMEGAVIHSPYTEYLGWAEEERDQQGASEMFWYTVDGQLKYAMRLNLTDGPQWMIAGVDTDRGGLDDYMDRSDPELTYEREEDGYTVFTAPFETQGQVSMYSLTGDEEDAENNPMFPYTCTVEYYINNDSRTLDRVVIDYEEYGRICEKLRLMEVEGLSEEEAKAQAEEAEDIIRMTTTIEFTDFNGDVQIDVPEELLDGTADTVQ